MTRQITTTTHTPYDNNYKNSQKFFKMKLLGIVLAFVALIPNFITGEPIPLRYDVSDIVVPPPPSSNFCSLIAGCDYLQAYVTRHLYENHAPAYTAVPTSHKDASHDFNAHQDPSQFWREEAQLNVMKENLVKQALEHILAEGSDEDEAVIEIERHYREANHSEHIAKDSQLEARTDSDSIDDSEKPFNVEKPIDNEKPSAAQDYANSIGVVSVDNKNAEPHRDIEEIIGPLNVPDFGGDAKTFDSHKYAESIGVVSVAVETPTPAAQPFAEVDDDGIGVQDIPAYLANEGPTDAQPYSDVEIPATPPNKFNDPKIENLAPFEPYPDTDASNLPAPLNKSSVSEDKLGRQDEAMLKPFYQYGDERKDLHDSQSLEYTNDAGRWLSSNPVASTTTNSLWATSQDVVDILIVILAFVFVYILLIEIVSKFFHCRARRAALGRQEGDEESNRAAVVRQGIDRELLVEQERLRVGLVKEKMRSGEMVVGEAGSEDDESEDEGPW